MKRISILGSTGSIGIKALEVIEWLPDKLKVVGLAAKGNLDLIELQARKFKPSIVALADQDKANELKRRLDGSGINGIKVAAGQEGIVEVATVDDSDLVVLAIVGSAGIVPTLKALEAHKDVALANKETMVCCGHIVTKIANNNGAKILPVDGEHNAIFQCLMGNRRHSEIRRLILTASGGPFRNYAQKDLETVTPAEALKHPNWYMGAKVTIDSATLMNKGLEVIEAQWLFNMHPSKIDVVIHPQSIIHSMVEFIDGSVLAQLGTADMRTPIQLALTYPERFPALSPLLSLTQIGNLSFEAVDVQRFPCLKLAYEAAQVGGTMPTVLSGADEVAVEAFLKNEIRFLDIPKLIQATMQRHLQQVKVKAEPNLNDILEADSWAKETARELIKAISGQPSAIS